MISSATVHAPPPALIVISGGASTPASGAPSVRSMTPSQQRLLRSLPVAQRVLELGCGQGLLAQAYKAIHPQVHWTGVDSSRLDLALASKHMDDVHCLDLHSANLSLEPTHFDLIVVNQLERLPHAVRVLADLGAWLASGGALYLLAENHACLSALSRLIEADLSTGLAACATVAESMDVAHPRHQSHSTIFKMLLDAGWTPTLVDHQPDEAASADLTTAVRHMADALGVPRGCADHVHRMKHFVIRAQRPFDDPVPASSDALFDVVVPTTKEQQLRVNVEQSPGLKEVQARIISYRYAATPAEALEASLAHVQADWVLLCHQDIYFPKGFGQRLNALLSTISAQDRPKTLLGFVGMGINRQTEQPEPAGFVVDRLHSADHPASESAVSIDELALVVSKDSIHRIDPRIGWHLWATDLCLSSICTHRVFPRIVRLPIFHNTHSGWQLPESFGESAEYLLQKHPAFSAIHSLCGVIDQGFVAQHRTTRSQPT